MYVLTSSGVTGFAVDWVERKGIEHLCNTNFPAETECWTFTEARYEEMGNPDFSTLVPDGKADFVTIGKTEWKKLHPDLLDDFRSEQEVVDAGQGK